MTPRAWHLVTGEYPPAPGGVADYTALVAAGLADAGCAVHVWTRGGTSEPELSRPGVTVHRVAGGFGPAGLVRLDRGLSAVPGPRAVFVQYTPHAYGLKALNLPFCLWVLSRRLAHGDDVRVMFHEVTVPFVRRPLRWNVLAVGNRVMAAVLLAACTSASAAIPDWVRILRGLGGRRVPVSWLPVPANVPADADPTTVAAARGGAGEVVGHFGTHHPLIAPLLTPALARLLTDRPGVRVLILGRGGEHFRDELVREHPGWADRVTATGGLPPADVAAHLRACDLVLQPYSDGVCTRRGSAMAALANGVPVVTTFGLRSEVFWKTRPAVALPAGPDALAATAARLLDDPAGRAALGRAGRELYEERFALRHTIAAVLDPPAPPPKSERRPVVAFVVNGGPDSAMGERARAFADRLAGGFDPTLVYRAGGKAAAAGRMLRALVAARPDVCYVLDVGAAGVAAAGAYRVLTGTPFVTDTGDAVVELGRVLGRGPAGVLATRALEEFALRAAAGVVVRGSYHAEVLSRRGVRATVVPDGVDVDQFAGPVVPADRPLTVGLVGSSVWVPARQTCYGWELVELVRLLKDRLPVRGLMIGDGSGIDVLRERCAEYEITDRVEFAGRVPYAELPGWLRRADVWLSTQTDDAIGRVRTTGKLPLYLAAGRFVLASRVGEAARVLPPVMLVEFRGSVDPDYPPKLAARLVELVAAGTDFSHRPECVALARDHFDYDRLAPRVGAVLRAVTAGEEWR